MKNRILQGIVTMAKKACYNSSGSASRASVYEPKMPTEVKEWKKTHTSLMEKFSEKFL